MKGFKLRTFVYYMCKSFLIFLKDKVTISRSRALDTREQLSGNKIPT